MEEEKGEADEEQPYATSSVNNDPDEDDDNDDDNANADLDADRLATLRHEVETLVHHVLPDQKDSVDAMMQQFKGREEELVDTLQVMLERAANQKARSDARQMAAQQQPGMPLLSGIDPGGIDHDMDNNNGGAMDNNGTTLVVLRDEAGKSTPAQVTTSSSSGGDNMTSFTIKSAALMVLAVAGAIAGTFIAINNNDSDSPSPQTNIITTATPTISPTPQRAIVPTTSSSPAPSNDANDTPSLPSSDAPSDLTSVQPTAVSIPPPSPPPTALPTSAPTPVPNNSCDNASGPLSFFTIYQGTTDNVDVGNVEIPACGDASAVDSPGAWFTVVGTGFPMKASTCTNGVIPELDDGDFNTQLTVLSGSSCQQLQCVGGNIVDNTDFCFFSSKSGVSWDSQLQQTYYIVVHGVDQQTGPFALTVTGSVPLPTGPPTLFPPTATVCFQSDTELQEAVDAYMRDGASPGSSVAAKYGSPIGSWCVGAVTDFTALFSALRNQRMAEFNEDLSGWDMSNAVTIREMFSGAVQFNQDISMWNVENVADMSFFAYQAAAFNQDIGNWNVGKVTRMPFAFYEATSFNQDLSSWDMSQTTNVQLMFAGASSFQQNLCAWGPQLVGQDFVNVNALFDGTSCPVQESPDLDATPPGPFCNACT